MDSFLVHLEFEMGAETPQPTQTLAAVVIS